MAVVPVENEEELPAEDSDAGKSPLSDPTPISILTTEAKSPLGDDREQSLTVSKVFGQRAVDTISTSDLNDERCAADRGITVAEWRAWKADNNYGDLICPLSHRSI